MAKIVSEKTPPVHAEGLQPLVGLYFAVRQGTETELQVDLVLTFGSCGYRVESETYAIEIFSCIVRLGLENCEIDGTTLYKCQLVPGDVKETSTETIVSKRGISGALSGGWKLLIGGAASVDVNVSGGHSSEKQRVTSHAHRIELITPAGQNSWRVGLPGRGDVRREERVLFGSYFREDEKPLCVARVLISHEPTALTLTVNIPTSQLLVRRKSGDAAVFLADLVKFGLENRGKAASIRHRAQIEELKGRVAGMAIGKAISKSQCDSNPRAREKEVLAVMQSYGQRVSEDEQ